MKNLYKIEDELYIISNTENVSENCWIITNGRLVQVSYLLSNEVAKGNKVILTTNKLLIKDGVQAIGDEFLEWFVKNPNCEYVEVEKHWEIDNWYRIIIPKEEPKQGTLKDLCDKINFINHREIVAYYNGLKNGAKYQTEKMYSEEEVKHLIRQACHHSGVSIFHGFEKWFNKF